MKMTQRPASMVRENYPDLQICENMCQQRWEWKIERGAWFFLYLLLAGIAMGLLGQGPLANAKLRGAPGGMEMEYQRFVTNKSPNDFQITVPPSSGEVRIAIDSRYLENIQINKITPEPQRVIAEADAVAFVFNADSPKPFQVQFFTEVQDFGKLDGWVSVADGPRQNFRQFVYP